MTLTVTKPRRLSAYDSDELVEPSIQCVIEFRLNPDGGLLRCDNVAVCDAIVTCDHGHERTQHYCQQCIARALSGGVDCRVCVRERVAPIGHCPVQVVTSWERKSQ